MDASQRQLTILQAKFSAYLSWSQPFLHALIARLDDHVRNVILCERTENLHRFPVRHVERIPTRYLVKPSLAVLAAGYLQRTWQPDLMHGHFGWSGLRLLMMKQILRVPLVVTFGGRDVGLQMQLPDFRELYGILLDACDAIICVSRDLHDKLLEVGVDPERVHVIYRGTDLDRFGYVDRRGRDPAAPVRILMVGRIVEKKGHRYALEALEPLVTAGHDVRLVIVGEGEAYHEVRRLRRRLGLTGHVEMAGATDHAGVRRHMKNSDLLLHCSVTPSSGDVEGIPNVVVEAQAMGLPVVGTHHGGIAEAVRHGETGFLVPEAAVEPLTRALEQLVGDRALRLRMGRQARTFVDEHFNLARQVESHLAIYEKIVAQAAADPDWRSRNWLPERYTELASRALLAQGIRHPTEFSIAELLERLVWARRLESRLTAGRVRDVGEALDLVGSAFVPEAARIAGRTRGDPEPARPPRVPLWRRALAPLRQGVKRVLRPLLQRSAGDEEGAESTLEQLYNLKAYVPQAIKFPLKISLGRVLVWAIEQRNRRPGERDVAQQLDAQVFAFFASGGTLRGWEAARAEEAARREAEDRLRAAG